MFDFKHIIDNVPDYQVFLTVAEMDESSRKLAEEFPDLVSCEEVGKSRKGEPILCLKIGNGSKNAFMFGCPHPNEPIGAMTVEYFSRALAEDKEFLEATGFTWYIIKSIDVDGTKLNEKWFKGPFTLTNYARNYFRPAGYEQAEWTFPIDYKEYHFHDTIPETKILMKIIDEKKPVFMYSLHNAGFGGTYWYISKDMPEIWEQLYAASEKNNVPLHLGEPEIPYITPFSKAIYPMISIREDYDYQEEYSEKSPAETLKAGDSSQGYTRTQGIDTVTLVTEMPYFTEPRIQSDKLMDYTRKEVALKNLESRLEQNEKIKALHAPVAELFGKDNPFVKMVELSLEHFDNSYKTQKKFISENEEYDELCKESEAIDNLEIPKFHKLFYWSLFIRSCEFELEKERTEAEIKLLEVAKEAAEKEFDAQAIIAEEALDYAVIPIQSLVRVQLESGLIVASNL